MIFFVDIQRKQLGGIYIQLLSSLPLLYQKHYRDLKEKFKNRYPYKDELYFDIMDLARTDQKKIEDILDNYQPGEHGGLMVLTENNKERSFREHWSANYRCYLEQKPTRGFEAGSAFNQATKLYIH